MGHLTDSFGRTIDYLRLSVTDRCNLRCVYCMPEWGIVNRPHSELLTFEEIIRVVEAGLSLGIDKIRLTGGEPLVRKEIVKLIGLLNNLGGLKDISMTTNGILLKEYALDLKGAGLKRLNISLDSLRPERYGFITRRAKLEDVLEGIRISVQAGFSPLKINVLLLGGINQDEIADFLRMTIENSICVRFLEFMPVNPFYKEENFVSSQAVMDIARRFYDIEETRIPGNGPAKVYKFKKAMGTFGIISAMSDKFCATCNRLRVTSDGLLKGCLHSGLGVNLRGPLKRGADKRALVKLIRLVVSARPKEHSLEKENAETGKFSMCRIGG
jgi:GTP 3',8-cyclase